MATRGPIFDLEPLEARLLLSGEALAVSPLGTPTLMPSAEEHTAEITAGEAAWPTYDPLASAGGVFDGVEMIAVPSEPEVAVGMSVPQADEEQAQTTGAILDQEGSSPLGPGDNLEATSVDSHATTTLMLTEVQLAANGPPAAGGTSPTAPEVAGPTVLAVLINDGGAFRSLVRSVAVLFSEDVSASVATNDLQLRNLTTGVTIETTALAVQYDSARQTATWTFPGLAGGVLPEGNYLATLPAGGISNRNGQFLTTDLTGNADYVFDFFGFYGDMDGDRDVDFADVFRFQSTYLKDSTQPGYDDRLDSDVDGDVDFADLFRFRQNYFKVLQPQSGLSASLIHDTGAYRQDGLTSDPTLALRIAHPELAAKLRGRLDGSATGIVADGPLTSTLAMDRLGFERLASGPLRDGIHALQLELVDGGGRVLDTFALSFTLDTSPPGLTLGLSGASDTAPAGDNTTMEARIMLTGQTEPDTLIQLFRDESLSQAIASVRSNGTGAYVFTDIGLEFGTHGFTATATDTAGNSRSTSTAITRLLCDFEEYRREWTIGEDALPRAGDTVEELLLRGSVLPEPAINGRVGVATGVFNADLFGDLVTVSRQTHEVRVQLGAADGTLGTPVVYPSGGSEPITVTVGNFVGDLFPDIAVAHRDGTVAFLMGKGDGTFVLRPEWSVRGLGEIVDLSGADFDGDGDLDLAVSAVDRLTVLISDDDPLASSPVTNGTFTLGSSGWVVEVLGHSANGRAGVVSVAGGIARLTENESGLVTLRQTFVIPPSPETLSFELLSLVLDDPPGGVPDAFEVSLLDAAGNSLVPTFRAESTAFYNVNPGDQISAASGVRRTGNRITLDISSVPPGTEATLYFDLIGNPPGSGSFAMLDNVQVRPEAIYANTFTSRELQKPAGGNGGMGICDVNGDGHLDIVISGLITGQFVIYYADGAGGFNRTLMQPPGPATVGNPEPGDTLTTATNTGLSSNAPGTFVGGFAIGDNPSLEPGLDVDLFRVQLNAGDGISVDVDFAPNSFDSYLRLFNASGQELAWSDDDPAPGEDYTYESFVRFVAVSSGIYYIGISNYGNDAYDPLTAGSGSSEGTGDYQISVTVFHGTVGQSRTISIGELASGDLATVNEIDEWRFDATAGQRIFLDFATLEAANFPFLSLGLRAPDGSAVINLKSGFDEEDLDYGPITLAQAGTYTLIVYGGGHDTVSYSFQISAVPPPETYTTTIGQIANGAIEMPGSIDRWEFEATAGQSIYLDFQQVSAGASFRLLAPSGTDLAQDQVPFASPDALDTGPTTLVETGKYVLEISGVGASTPTYRFQLWNVPPVVTHSIAIGDVADGAIVSVGAREQWRFEGTPGQVVFIDFQQIGAATELRLFAPDGTQIVGAFAGLSSIGNLDQGPITLSQSGTYILQVAGLGDDTPSYRFQIWNVPPPVAHSTNIGDVANGSIPSVGASEQWFFQAAAGQSVFIDFQQITAATSYRLLSPDGAELATAFAGSTSINSLDKGPVLLSQSGTHILQVAGFGDDTPSYRFQLWDVPPPVTHTFSIGNVASGSISNVGAREQWRFDATAGQSVFIDFQQISTGTSFRLVAPDGTEVTRAVATSNPDNLDVGPRSLSQAGTYIIEVYGLGDDTPNYQFQLWNVPSPEVRTLASDEVTAGAIETPGAKDEWRFSALAGQEVFLDFLEVTGGSLRYQLFAPDGSQIVSRTSTNPGTLDAGPITLALGGVYQMVVQGTGDDTPTYQFRVLGISPPDIQAIHLGDLVDGTVPTLGASDEWHLDAIGGESVFIDFRAVSATVRLQLIRPNGTVQLTDTDSSPENLDNGPLLLPNSGTYRIVVTSLSDTGATYRFQLWQVPPPQITHVTAGQAINDAIEVPGATHLYLLDVGIGEKIFLDFGQTSGNISTKLTAPNGAVVGGFSSSGGPIIGYDSGPLDGPGPYTLEVKGYQDHTPTYQFAVLAVPPNQVRTVALGPPVDGNIQAPGASDEWILNASAGEKIFVDFLQVTAQLRLDFYRPNGSLLYSRSNDFPDIFDKGPIELPETGAYRFVVTNLTDRAATYRFQLWDVAPDVTEVLPLNTPVSGFRSPGQTVTYTWTGVAGEEFVFDVQENEAGHYFTLFDPTGTEIFLRQRGDQFFAPLSRTGTYQLLAGYQMSDDDAVGSFRIQMQRLETPVTGLPDSRGTEFWVGFPRSHSEIFSFGPPEITLFITADRHTSGAVTIPSLTFVHAFSLEAGELIRIPLPTQAEVHYAPDIIENKGIHITASDEVSVYGMSRTEFSTDAMLVLPVDILGTNYFVMSYQQPNTLDPSQFVIVGTEDGTDVTITLPVATTLHAAGTSYTIHLNRGQTYETTADLGNADDLTGAIISATRPIAVFGSTRCANIPRGVANCDYLLEQIPPVETWGRQFVTMPLATRQNGDTFRFLAAEDGTAVTVNGVTVATLNRGQFHERLIAGPAYISSNKPILVAQFANSTQFDGVTGDPFMMLIPPFEQFLGAYTVTTPVLGFQSHFINVVVPTEGIGTVVLDGAVIPASAFTTISSSGFSGAQVIISENTHHLSGPVPFGISIYGFAFTDSYGYPGGMSLAPVARVASLELSPEAALLGVGAQHLAIATVRDGAGNPVRGVRVDLRVTGANTARGFVLSDAHGQAQFVYSGQNAGQDSIVASVGTLTDSGSVTWISAPPQLTVTSPVNGDHLSPGNPVLIVGQAIAATPLARIAQVTVNGTISAAIDAAGHFFAVVQIVEGENRFSIVATDSVGQTATATLTVFGTGPADPVRVSQLQDVTASGALSYQGTTFNRKTRTLHTEARLANTGSALLDRSVLAVIDPFAPPGIALVSRSGLTDDGRPFVAFDDEIDVGGLPPGETSREVLLSFGNPESLRFDFTTALLARGNAAPSFVSIPNLEAVAGRPYEYPAVATDPNGHTLSFALLVRPEGMAINSATGMVNWTPTLTQVGTQQIQLTVTDGHGGSATQLFQLEVRPTAPNHPPMFRSAPLTQIGAAETYRYQPDVFDTDQDPLEFFLDDRPTGMQIDSQTGLVTLPNAVTGAFAVTIRVEDGLGGKATQSYVLSIGEPSSNPGAPLIRSTPPAEAIAGVGYLYQVVAEDPENDPLQFSLLRSPEGMRINSVTGRIQWLPVQAQLGIHTVEIKVDDGLGGVATQLFAVTVTANRPPLILSTPGLLATVNETYTYAISAQDPDGQTLSFELIDGPDDMSLDAATGELTWTPGSTELGAHTIELRVRDPLGAEAQQAYQLIVRRTNLPPQFTSQPVTQVVLGEIYRYDADATDTEDAVRFTLISPPTGMTIDPRTGMVLWISSDTQIGEHAITLRATDERGASVDQAYTLHVLPDTTAPVATVSLSINVVAPGEPVTVHVEATDNVRVRSLALEIDGTPVSLDMTGTATFTPTHPGFMTVTVYATDSSGNVGTATRSLRVVDPTDHDAPFVQIISPAFGATITYLTEIRGTVTDPNLEFYRLEYARADLVDLENIAADNAAWRSFAEGHAQVTNGVLGVFDPTLLANDNYGIRLVARDISGNTWVEPFLLAVEGQAKLGNFRLEFTDLAMPLAGIPIEIRRVYDTLNSQRQGDFGFGWHLETQDADIRETIAISDSERLYGMLGAEPFEYGTRVYLNSPEGRRLGFTFKPVPQAGALGGYWLPRFVADPGVFAQLEVDDVPLQQRADGTFGLFLFNVAYNPSDYTLITKDGTRYRYNQFEGLKTITDLNANVVTFTVAGIVHSSGESITFVRDSLERITRIIDPTGHSLTYHYNPSGDLDTVTDPGGLQVQFIYAQDPAHYLVETLDPLGNRARRMEYDESGRFVAFTDAMGNRSTRDFSPEDFTGTYTDALGQVTELTYDARGNLLVIRNPIGAETRFSYDANDNPVSITDALGHRVTKTYDDRGNVTSITDPLEGVQMFTYDEFSHLTSQRDQLGRLTRFLYDSRGNMIGIQDAAGGVTSLTFDASGVPTRLTDQRGNTTSYIFSHGRPIELVHPDGSVRRMDWNHLGALMSFEDERGNAAVSTYDASGRVVSVRDPTGATTSFQYNGHLKVSETDPLGRMMHFEYDAAGRLIRKTHMSMAMFLGAAAMSGDSMLYEYDANDRLIAKTDELGRTTRYTYRADGKLLSTTDPLGGVTSYEYDLLGQVTALVDPLSHRWSYEYDAMGHVVRETDPMGGIISYVFDAAGNQISRTDENGNTERTEFDALNRPLREINALGGVTTSSYDAAGNLISTTDPAGHTALLEYDNRNRLVRTRAPDGSSTEVRYDEAGNRVAAIDELGLSTLFAYDAMGRLITTTDPLGGVSRQTYDAAGNRLSSTDALGRTTRFEYDALDRMVSTTDPLGGITRFTYDAVGNRTSLTDPLGQTTTFAYDARNRVVRETDPLGNVTSTTYDAAGQTSEIIDRNGRRKSFAYDALGYIVSETWWDHEQVVQVIRSTYDPAHNLVSKSDGNSHYTFTYDALNRITSIDNAGTVGPRIVLRYAYDAAGNVTSVSDNLGVTVGSNYDDMGQLTERNWVLAGAQPVRVAFAYNQRGEVEGISRRTDLTQTATTTTLHFDAAGRMTGLEHRDPLGNSIALYDYVYDAAGELISESHHGQTFNYSYNATGQLTREASSASGQADYSYDRNGNRTTAGIVIGGNNRVLSDGTYSYEYDAEGSMAAKTELSSGSRTTFTYDHLNRLVSVAVTTSGGTRRVEFTYDALDRRIAKTVDGVTSYTVYERENAWADFDSNGNVTVRYLFGDGNDQILARFRPGEGVAWYLTDHLGTVRDLVDASGQLLNHIEYGAFGKILSQTNPGAGDRFTYAGREYDAETGLYYYRARYYDPQLGRFISQDPIGFNAGDWNLYRYVGNSPSNSTDPTGLFSSFGYIQTLEGARAFLATQSATPVIIGLSAGFAAGAAVAAVAVTGTAVSMGITSGLVKPAGTAFVLLAAYLDAEHQVEVIVVGELEVKTATITLEHWIATVAIVFSNDEDDEDEGCEPCVPPPYEPASGAILGTRIPEGDRYWAENNVSDYPQAHHIIEGTRLLAAPAREALRSNCIGINDGDNGVWLPQSSNFATNLPPPGTNVFHNYTFRRSYTVHINDVFTPLIDPEDCGRFADEIRMRLAEIATELQEDGPGPLWWMPPA